MFMLTETGTFAQEIKKSRFVAFAGPVATEEEAKAFIAAHADPAATHNCWAFRIGPRVRFNDDGEVGGTAGKPILQVIEGNELDHAVVLVTRYYGGILLGTGGLVRAYGGTAGECVKRIEKGPIVLRVRFSIASDFNDMAVLKSRLLPLAALTLEAETFAEEGAILTFSMPADGFDEIARLVQDLTRGRAIAKLEG